MRITCNDLKRYLWKGNSIPLRVARTLILSTLAFSILALVQNTSAAHFFALSNTPLLLISSVILGTIVYHYRSCTENQTRLDTIKRRALTAFVLFLALVTLGAATYITNDNLYLWNFMQENGGAILIPLLTLGAFLGYQIHGFRCTLITPVQVIRDFEEIELHSQ